MPFPVPGSRLSLATSHELRAACFVPASAISQRLESRRVIAGALAYGFQAVAITSEARFPRNQNGGGVWLLGLPPAGTQRVQLTKSLSEF